MYKAKKNLGEGSLGDEAGCWLLVAGLA